MLYWSADSAFRGIRIYDLRIRDQDANKRNVLTLRVPVWTVLAILSVSALSPHEAEFLSGFVR